MINYYRHFHLRPKSSVRGLISKLDSQLRRKNLDDQEVLLILEAMYIFSHDYLKKLYDLSLKSKNPPPKWTRILNREKAKVENRLQNEGADLLECFNQAAFWKSAWFKISMRVSGFDFLIYGVFGDLEWYNSRYGGGRMAFMIYIIWFYGIPLSFSLSDSSFIFLFLPFIAFRTWVEYRWEKFSRCEWILHNRRS